LNPSAQQRSSGNGVRVVICKLSTCRNGALLLWNDNIFLTMVVGDDENLTPSEGLYLGKGVRDSARGILHWLVYCFDLIPGKSETVGDQRSIRL